MRLCLVRTPTQYPISKCRQNPVKRVPYHCEGEVVRLQNRLLRFCSQLILHPVKCSLNEFPNKIIIFYLTCSTYVISWSHLQNRCRQLSLCTQPSMSLIQPCDCSNRLFHSVIFVLNEKPPDRAISYVPLDP